MSSAPTNETLDRRGSALFLGAGALLTMGTLWPLWSLRLLPLQDYPHHLYLAQILTTWNDAALDWKQHYETNLGPRPYMLWFLLMRPLAAVFGVETAGRLVFSGVVLLTAAIVLRARRDAPAGLAPWGALLLFPLSFHQSYFMGFTNYILSIPLLFLAYLQLETLSRGGSTPKQYALHAACVLALFLAHPYAALVYLGLAAAAMLAHLRDRARVRRILGPAGAVALLFAIWFLTQHGQPRSAAAADRWEVRWWPLEGTVGYYLMMFTDMRWHSTRNVVSLALWLAAIGVVVVPAVRQPSTGAIRWTLAAFLATVTGVFVLPFWFGYYSYFNLRLAPVSYFALALLLGRLPVSRLRGLFVASCCLGLLAISARTQRGVAEEAAEVLPVARMFPRNSSVLPLMFDSRSEWLDPAFFYEIHSHEVAYLHLAAGGGVDPDLFPSTMLPVQYRAGYYLPFPQSRREYGEGRYDTSYDYYLLRGATPEDRRHYDETARLVASSGEWQLYRRIAR